MSEWRNAFRNKINGLHTSMSMKNFNEVVGRFESTFNEIVGNAPDELVYKSSSASDKVTFWAHQSALRLVDEGETITVYSRNKTGNQEKDHKIGEISFNTGFAVVKMESDMQKRKFYLDNYYIDQLFERAYYNLIK